MEDWGKVAAGGTVGYDAFISYSHALDGALARALQTGLERFAKPWYRARALRVFRDTASLAANPGLWSSIEKALASSGWLVLMASPDAARSKWVNREVEWWLKNKSPQRLLVVLTEGEFAWDGNVGRGDDTTAALPPALHGIFVEEPRWVDLRWLHNLDQVAQSNPRLREVVADVAAAVREVPKDILVGEHIRQHRRTMRLARGSVAALAVLLIAAVVAAVVAVGQRNQAREQARIATARQLVAQASNVLESDPRTALRLGIAAKSIYPDSETRGSLLDLLAGTRYAGALAATQRSQALTGHTGPVRSVAFSPNGRTLVTGSGDKVILWDLTDPATPRQLGPPLTGSTNPVAFTPDGRSLVTGGALGTVILWNLIDPTRPQQLGQSPGRPIDLVLSVAFSPDGRILATANYEHTVTLWDVTDPATPRQLGQPLTGHTDRVESVAFSPDGRTLATGGADTMVILWDLTDPNHSHQRGQPLTGHTSSVYSVAFSPNGRTVATGSGDINTVILWDLTDSIRPHQVGQPLTGQTSVRSVAFSLDGQILATGSDDETVILRDLTDPAHPHQLNELSLPSSLGTGHSNSVYSVAFSPDRRTLATGTASGSVILWDLTDPTRPRQLGQPFTDNTSWVSSVAFSPNGRTLAASTSEHMVALWDLTDPATPRQLDQPLTGHTDRVSFSPDGRTLATADSDHTTLWDLTDPANPRRLGQPFTDYTQVVVFAPDGRRVATSAGKTVILWDLTDPAAPRRLGQPLTGGDTGPVFGVAFSSDGRTLATASYDHMILWDLTDPAAPRQLGQPLTGYTEVVAFAPDGRTVATSDGSGTVILWDLTDSTAPRQLGQPLTSHTSSVYPVVHSAVFSPDGRTLVTGGDIDGRVILWDLTDPSAPRQLGQPLTGHTSSVYLVAFSPDGRTLATSSSDKTVILWDFASFNNLRDHTTERACVIAKRGFDRDEWTRYITGLKYQDTCPG